jgi:hypothetical protein
MPDNDLDYEELTRELAKNFNTLADAVQILSDRNTILQYKLQYAHTEVSFPSISFTCLILLYHDEKL